MIQLTDISVRFDGGESPVEAVKSVSLHIGKGEIFGIVGTSGAGKSTLVRTINLLERPNAGTVSIDGVDITRFKGEELRKLRLRTGMIFQQFNLINTRTVFDNVAFALKVAGRSKQEIGQRVPELLALVGLADKSNAYPAQLSGGQKQRVGIARALANSPQVVLCDEPTSALDLETTASILELLQEINRKFGITIVIITHEIAVVKAICDRVAVMDAGTVVEKGAVYDIFANPQHEFTRQLVARTLNLELPPRLLDSPRETIIKLHYRGERAEEPVISETIRNFNVQVNILHGHIEYIGGKPLGSLVISLDGEPDAVSRAATFIKSRTAGFEVLK
ncbi:methionine ABC transporter ATP-binding protein [Trichlorobacter ammonificans]|uniref:L-methionine/D-methionine ABC transporter ATP binding subunit n=1 Tax=Trichlorobacter ammonificans TaxID=2916410 RepID=A0ABN8HK65_9BACT|nr:methionine ABC transporter ATP-binding protein [Trichlorobacter ammonificans]CAH2031976.1 L-methionine/D-methionine ABC transporter ATP binding subunit [Trichlorobacter ammonificans]